VAIVSAPLPAGAVEALGLPDAAQLQQMAQQAQQTPPALDYPKPAVLQAMDKPNDDGSQILLLTSAPPEGVTLMPELQVDGQWDSTESVSLVPKVLSTKGDFPAIFGSAPADPDTLVIPVSAYYTAGPDGKTQSHPLATGTNYAVRLAYMREDGAKQEFDAGNAAALEQQFDRSKLNVLVLSVLFAAVILAAIAAARKNPNLFIRRIAGLEAVDEAVGRATEMGKAVFHINGLDSLTTLSTLAGVNILGRIARITAQYESDLVVPAFDPVVLTVSQEVVRNAYIEAGRPDAYRADNIFFLTDQQFSYTASVCGMMVRDKPAAIFLLGAFYAESLMLAETGASIGAIQIAGTDQQAQLPFFITACDYTLIGEELYAASAYLSREPLLLGSLKGQDLGKAFLLVVMVVGCILASLNVLAPGHHLDFLTQWFTAYQ
jgi:hypothetical protein